MIVGGVFWSATYVLIIRRGFKDQTYGMPFAALCANISWEAIFSFINPHDSPQVFINYVWFALDVVIVYQFLRYGKKEFLNLTRLQFYGMFVLGVVIAFTMIILVNDELNDEIGAYAAFGQNLMMSILFVLWLLTRSDNRGQSFYIGLFKMIGTALSSYAFYSFNSLGQSSLLQFLFVTIFVFDVIYLVGFYYKYKKEKPLTML